MNNKIFRLVASALIKGAQKLNITYNEINIIVYYLIVPLIWSGMIDYLISMPVTTSFLLGFWTCVAIFFSKNFSELCDVIFVASQTFLLSFQKIGWNYVKSSVIICVILPIIFTLFLSYLIYIK